MRIYKRVNDPVVIKATVLVETYYDYPGFLKVIEDSKFTNTSDNGIAIADKIAQNNKEYFIDSFTSINPWSKSIGHFDKETYWLNSRKLHALNLEERTANIFHEICGHGNGYQHKGNRVTVYNLETVPYKASRLFVRFLKEKGLL